jgi:hypothetical protein
VDFLDALDANLASLRADLAETPTLTLYLSINHRIDEARESLKRLHRSYNARSISSRRDDISNQLILLEKQLLEIWKPVVDNQLGGEKFDCKRHYDRPIDSYTPLTQLLMLLAAIICVITGLSRRDSEFIILSTCYGGVLGRLCSNNPRLYLGTCIYGTNFIIQA